MENIGKMENKYLISIVMAIYNSEPFLRETLDSIVDQDISQFELPFEKIVQVIMVDDGSTDDTDKIVDEYAAAHPNFLAVHKKNGGVASARNEGLKYVEGKYMNFLDSDDKFSSNVLWEMYNFFEIHYEDTDIVTMPLFFFDAARGAHWQNGKFNNGNRIINLFREYDALLMFVNASFFKSEYKNKVFFDGNLVCGEDMKYICTILSEKMTLGVINSCKYFYRRRSAGEESLIQSAKKKTGWYFDYFTCLIDWGIDFAKNKWGYVPYYFQNLFVRDIGWKFVENYESTALSLLGESEYTHYKRVLFNSLKNFDDDVILKLDIYIEFKNMMLCKKHDSLPEFLFNCNDMGICFNNKAFFWLSDCYTKIDFLKISGNTLTIEGFTMFLGISEDEPIEIMLKVSKQYLNDQFIKCDINQKRDVNQYRLGETLFRGIAFIGEVTLGKDEEKAEISVVCVVRGHKIIKKDIRFGKFSPIGSEHENAYYIKDGYMLTHRQHCIYFEKCNAADVKVRENKFLAELRNSGKESDKKAYWVLKAVKILRKLKHRQIWLISDRVNKADDNGEAIFRYLNEIRPNGIDVYFVINEDCLDYERMSKIGKVIPYFSRKHKMLQILADVIISSAADDFVVNPFQNFFTPYRRFISNQKFVFLQHGITKDDLSGWLQRYNNNLSGFVTSAQPEYQSILNYNYFYTPKEVWLTGFPRYDRLYDDRKKYITIMPTWRKKLMSIKDGVWYPKGGFSKSEYFGFYNQLMNNRKLISRANELGYTLCFLPHVNTQTCMEYFKKNENVIFWGLDKSYREIFAESDMIVTDYSSVAFDFAYLRKPLVYSQFDKEEFFNGEHVYTKGYFDYERDGFGEVTYNLASTVDIIIEYMEKGCQLKDKYRERIDSFFAFNDKNNCRRVYDKIVKLLKE